MHYARAQEAYEQVCMQAEEKILQEQEKRKDTEREASLKRQSASGARIWVRDLLGEKRKVEAELKELHEKLQQREMEILKAERKLKEVHGKLLRSEVAKDRAEGELKKTVEQRNKWERLGRKTKEEKDRMEKDLRQQLREAKLAAKRAPTTTTMTQTHQIPPPQQCSLATQTEENAKPTYASVAVQASVEKAEAEPAPTTAASTSAVDIEMKDWSPYEDLSEYERDAEDTHTIAVRRPTATTKPAAPRAATTRTGTATNHRALVVHGISFQQPIVLRHLAKGTSYRHDVREPLSD